MNPFTDCQNNQISIHSYGKLLISLRTATMHTTSAMCFKGFSQRDVLSSRWKTMKNEGFVATLLIHLAPLITKCALNDIISCDVADALIISVVVTLRGVL